MIGLDSFFKSSKKRIWKLLCCLTPLWTQLFANLGAPFLQSILKMVFYLCGWKCRSSSDSAEFDVTLPATRVRSDADLLNKTLKHNYEPSKHDFTESHWAVGCKSKTLLPLCFMWTSIFDLLCSTVAENGKRFSILQMQFLGSSYQQLCLRPRMSGQLGVLSYSGRFNQYWPS